MELPGGLWRDGRLERDFAYRELTGGVEMALSRAMAGADTTPAQVSAVLAAVLDHIGGTVADLETVRELSVGDRQFLMRGLAVALGRGHPWLTAACHDCGQPFDFQITLAELPVKPAGAGYPYVEVALAGADVRLRLPDGGDQETVAGVSDDREALGVLIDRCLVDGPSRLDPLDDHDLIRIDRAMEAVAPEVALRAEARCPECGAHNQPRIDPYLGLEREPARLLDEIHEIATAYHWSEAEILAMPRDRRHRYLHRITRGAAGPTS